MVPADELVPAERPSGAKPNLASQTNIQAEEAPFPARARLEAKAAQVHRDLFRDEAAGEGDGEQEEAGVVPAG